MYKYIYICINIHIYIYVCIHFHSHLGVEYRHTYIYTHILIERLFQMEDDGHFLGFRQAMSNKMQVQISQLLVLNMGDGKTQLGSAWSGNPQVEFQTLKYSESILDDWCATCVILRLYEIFFLNGCIGVELCALNAGVWDAHLLLFQHIQLTLW